MTMDTDTSGLPITTIPTVMKSDILDATTRSRHLLLSLEEAFPESGTLKARLDDLDAVAAVVASWNTDDPTLRGLRRYANEHGRLFPVDGRGALLPVFGSYAGVENLAAWVRAAHHLAPRRP